jgi:hypothetical protein
MERIMADDKKNYKLEAETGHYKVVIGSINPIANSAIIAANSITSFGHDFVIVPPTKGGSKVASRTTDAAYDPSKVPGAIKVSSTFTIAFTAILVLIVLSFFAEIWMASVWVDHPTGLQDKAFSTMDWILKGGVGLIVGLLGGKVSGK